MSKRKRSGRKKAKHNILEGLRFLKVPMDKLRPDPDNPRTHDDRNLESIRSSVETFQQRTPLVVNRKNKNLIEKGNGTYMICKALGWTHIAAVFVEDDPSTETGYKIADNRTAELAGWDAPVLNDLIVKLEETDFDIELTGFTLKDLAELTLPKPVKAPDDPVVPPVKPVTKPGDLYLLGDHRVLCGDCTSRKDVARLMDGKKASMVFTDPPYGVSYKSQSKTRATKTIKGDKKRHNTLVDTLLVPALRQALLHTVPAAAFYIWHASVTRDDFTWALNTVGLVERQYIIWAKTNFVLGRSDYHWMHEPCFYASREDHTPAFHGDRTNSTIWNIGLHQTAEIAASINDGILISSDQGGTLFVSTKIPKKKLRHFRIEGDRKMVLTANDTDDVDLWFVASEMNTDHPTQKPIALARKAIPNSSQPGEIVLDLFLGSGCTLLGAEDEDRICYAMDKDPQWIDAAVRRWQERTGNKPTRVRQGKKNSVDMMENAS